MATSTRPATLRVVNDNVDLGGGISMPQGDYDGTITHMIIMLRGQEIRQVSKVAIYLSEPFLQSIGFPAKPNSSSLGITGDFTPSYIRKDIVEV